MYACDVTVASLVHNKTPYRDIIIGHSSSGQLLGATCVSPYLRADGTVAAEIDVSVEHGSRRKGIASHLIARALDVCRREGVTTAEMHIGKRNHPTRKIALSFKAHESNEGVFEIQLPIRSDNSVRLTHLKTAENNLLFSSDHEPQCLLIHGAGGGAWQWQSHLMRALAQRGIGSVAVQTDFMSHRNVSCAHPDNLTTPAMIDATEKFPIRAIVGHSLGCIAATNLATIVDPRLLTLCNPMPANGLSPVEARHSAESLRCHRAAGSLLALHRYESTKRWPGRLLVIHGTTDKVSPHNYAKRTIDHHRRASSALKIFDAGHLSIKSPLVTNHIADQTRVVFDCT